MDEVLKNIPNSHKWKNIRKIEGGFDDCLKYYFEYDNKKYIVKIFSNNNYEKKKREYCILQKMQEVDFIKPTPITLGKLDENNYYYILTWVEGKTLTEYCENKSEKELYDIGLKIGDIITKIHEVKVREVDLSNKISKIENKMDKFKKVKKDYTDVAVNFLEKEYNKLTSQPISIVHGDLNQDNIIVDDNGNIGIIDFGNADIDYSYQDLHQVQMYNRFLSIPLSVGIINGYLKEKENTTFWESFKIYSAYFCLSKILWAHKFDDESLISEMLKRSKQTVIDFNYFKSEKPLWYSERMKLFEDRDEEER